MRTAHGVAWESAVVVRVPLAAAAGVDLVDEALVPLLPIEVRIDRAQLSLFDGRRWSEHASLALG